MIIQRTIILTVLSLLFSFIFGQVSRSDLELIKTLFNKEISKRINSGNQIIYTGGTSGVDEFKNKILQIKTFKSADDTNRLITLSQDEQEYILSQLDFSKKFIWPDSLFNNSKRVSQEEQLQYITKANPYVYTFSKPIYLRNNTIALIGFARMCGSECGQTETAFYKYENGKWINYVSLGIGYW